jgi:hypothetical protein
MVTVAPEIVAGPLVTEYVIAPLDAELALTAKGASPYVCAGMAANVSVVDSALTAKLVEAVAAA